MVVYCALSAMCFDGVSDDSIDTNVGVLHEPAA